LAHEIWRLPNIFAIVFLSNAQFGIIRPY